MTTAAIAISIVLIIVAGATAVLVAYFNVQRHRIDAAALGEYRKLAEDAAAGQRSLDERFTEVTTRLAAIEALLRSVDQF